MRPSVGPRHHPHAIDDPPGQFAVSDHEGPHVHMVASDPTGQFVIANDAGLDLTLIWRLDMQAGRLLPVRHAGARGAVGLCAAALRVSSERKIFLQSLRTRRQGGGLRLRRLAGRHAPQAERVDPAAEIRRQQSRRGDPGLPPTADSSMSAIGCTARSRCSPLPRTASSSSPPRPGCTRIIRAAPRIDPSGEIIFSCNQKGDSITSFRINPASGALAFTGRFEPVGSPAVMVMLKPRLNGHKAGSAPMPGYTEARCVARGFEAIPWNLR